MLLRRSRATLSYTNNANTIRVGFYRLTLHAKGDVELYNHLSDPAEAVNIADKISGEGKRTGKNIKRKSCIKTNFLE